MIGNFYSGIKGLYYNKNDDIKLRHLCPVQVK